MAYQKGLNKNRNHHDSLSNSGSGNYHHANRKRNDDPIGAAISDVFNPHSYGQGKHSKGGKPKQHHW